MEFETLKRSHLKRNILIAVVVVLVISAIILQFTRARYRVTESIPLVNGTINYTLPDLNIIALYINGEAAEELDSSKNYSLDTSRSTCTYKDGSTISNLSLSYDSSTKTFTISPYTTKGTKCTLYFNEVYFGQAVEVIESLYSSNQDILAYDGTTDNNLRYIGADPANYVYFNCDDYSNPTSDTCELWRIIGIFNENTHGIDNYKLIKLVKNEESSYRTYDNDYEHNWSTSSIQQTLTNSYNGSGITSATKDMIETVTWKLGGHNSNSITANSLYAFERGTNVYGEYPISWEGKMALIYPSDYGYATDGGSIGRDTCLSYNLSSWSSYSDCYNNDWLYTGSAQWTITPYLSSYSVIYSINSNGQVRSKNVTTNGTYRSAVYLSSNVSITGGTGTSTDPYTLSN